jgi:hypothetical protein
MGNKIPLGAAAPAKTAVVEQPQSLEQQVTALRKQVEMLTAAFHSVNSVRVKDRRQTAVYAEFDDFFNESNKDGLPVGMSLIGHSQRGGTCILTVDANGYRIGTTPYDSLSAAAEASSGVRRSGWTFWKTYDGRSVKEVFGKR